MPKLKQGQINKLKKVAAKIAVQVDCLKACNTSIANESLGDLVPSWVVLKAQQITALCVATQSSVDMSCEAGAGVFDNLFGECNETLQKAKAIAASFTNMVEEATAHKHDAN